jgi:hypothetical protein
LQAEKYFFTGGPGKKMIEMVSRRARRELCEAFSTNWILAFARQGRKIKKPPLHGHRGGVKLLCGTTLITGDKSAPASQAIG